MQDEALQAAFEIKTECDEISRRLLRWHWEQKPGSHSLDALLRHIAQRQKESPDYYDRMPDLSGKTSWQQLDTTLCMRVLLDPEKDAAKPLDLLGNTRHPGAARRACNAVRTARNEAAHAADAQDAAQAALLFNEAIESLEEGYADTAFRENELAQYYREAESFLEQCGARKAARPADNTRGQSKAAKPAARTGSRTSGGKASNNSRTAARKRSAPARRSSKKKRTGNRTILTLLLVVLVLGLLLMFCPFCADVQWAEGIFQVKAGALGITFPVFRYPAPEKPEKKKKEKKKKTSGAQKPKKEAPPRQKAKLTLQIVCTILKGAGKLTRAIIGSLRFTRIDVVLGVRGEDPAEAARSYGRLNAWLYPTLGFLDRFLYLDFAQLRLLPDFGSAEPTVKDHVFFRITARAYAIVFTLLRVLYALWREKVLDVFI